MIFRILGVLCVVLAIGMYITGPVDWDAAQMMFYLFGGGMLSWAIGEMLNKKS